MPAAGVIAAVRSTDAGSSVSAMSRHMALQQFGENSALVGENEQRR
jgi:hypothetical protein